MRLSWRVVPSIGRLAAGGLSLAGACADTPASPLRDLAPAESPAALLIDAEGAAVIASGLADVETRVLPTLGDEASSLRAAVAALHGALDRRDARALSSEIGGVLEAARAMTAHRADVAYELEPLALSLKQISAVLPTSLRCADEDFSITRGER